MGKFNGIEVTASICIADEENPRFNFTIGYEPERPLSEAEFESNLFAAARHIVTVFRHHNEKQQYGRLGKLLREFHEENRAAGLCD